MVGNQWLSVPILFRFLPLFTGIVYHLKIYLPKTTTTSLLLHRFCWEKSPCPTKNHPVINKMEIL
jgi:hypothetical protein